VGARVTQCSLGQGLPSYQVPSSHLATTDMGRNFFLRGAVPLGGGAGSASNTMLPRLRPTIVPSGILIHPAVLPQQTWAENWGAVSPFWGGVLGPHLPQCGNEAYLHTEWHLDPCSRLATIDMGRKLGPLFGER